MIILPPLKVYPLPLGLFSGEFAAHIYLFLLIYFYCDSRVFIVTHMLSYRLGKGPCNSQTLLKSETLLVLQQLNFCRFVLFVSVDLCHKSHCKVQVHSRVQLGYLKARNSRLSLSILTLKVHVTTVVEDFLYCFNSTIHKGWHFMQII